MSAEVRETSNHPDFGALVISLDFELQWGVRDTVGATHPYRRNIAGVWESLPRVLALFEEFGVAATWATVGFLFARSREELERFSPRVRPRYANAALWPYDEPIGESEADDPYHYAPSLIEAVRRTPRQEIATHTFSHYYCQEPGDELEAFAADLDSAIRIAAQHGITLRSIVFPRNYYNPAYEELLLNAGITSYRGKQRASMYWKDGLPQRAGRLLDSFLNLTGAHTTPWDRIRQENGMCNVPASFFLRPYSRALGLAEPLRLRRICGALERAARAREIVHLWWHPHNFGVDVEENLAMLRSILLRFDGLRREHGMRSLTMCEVADAVNAAG